MLRHGDRNFVKSKYNFIDEEKICFLKIKLYHLLY